MQALTFHKTTNQDLSDGLEVLVPSVNGTLDIGLDTPYKKAVIDSQTEYGWLAGDGEYMADEIVLIKYDYEVYNSVEDEIIFQGDERSFIDFMSGIAIENEDYNYTILDISDACEYIDEYCDNLELREIVQYSAFDPTGEDHAYDTAFE